MAGKSFLSPNQIDKVIVSYSGDFDYGTVLWSEGGKSLNNLAPKFARAKLDLFLDCLRQQA